MVALAAVGTGTAYAATAPRDVVTPQLRQLVATIDGPRADPRARRYRDLRKLDGAVQALAAGQLASPRTPPAPANAAGLDVTPGGRVLVDVYVDGPIAAARTALQAAGLDVLAVSDREPQRLVSGWLPAASAPDVAGLDVTRGVLAVPSPVTSAGTPMTQGDAPINGPAARALAGAGADVPIGVISDSFTVDGGLATSISSGNLPANTAVLPGREGPPDGTDEGRAMAEILYDTAAPAVSRIRFATGFVGGAAGKAAAVNALVADGAKVITDDVTWPVQPFFQDGVVEQAVDAARAAGVLYVAAAGNSGRQAWEGTYRDGGSGYNDFDPSGATDTAQTLVAVPPGGTIKVNLQWDEAWGLASDSFSATVSDGLTSQTATNAAGYPSAYVTWKNTTLSNRTVTLQVRRTAGSIVPLLKYVYTGDFALGAVQEHATNSPTIGPDAAGAAGALTVAAVQWGAIGGANVAEPFSSRGPLTHYRDKNGNRLSTPVVRNKPELAAPDGVATSVPGFACSPDPYYDCFYGTSAASPSAAAVAALVWSANPTLPVSLVAAILTDPRNAIPCLPLSAAFDESCGAGIVLADRAVAQTADVTPPTVGAVVDPAAPDGAGGWYVTAPIVSWSKVDPESATIDVSGCATQTVTADGPTTATCTARSVGGTTTGAPITVNVDRTPPTAPTITGIAATTYATGAVPPQSAIGCGGAQDPTSGVTGCVVSGYDDGPGSHAVTATATNGAGLTSTASVSYTVAPPVTTTVPVTTTPTTTTTPVPPKPLAATALTVGTLKLATLRGRGLGVTVRAALARTRLVVTLTAKLPRAKRATNVGTLTTTVAAGKRTVRVKLTKKARDALRRASRVTVTATVTATATGAAKAVLKRSVVVRR